MTDPQHTINLHVEFLNEGGVASLDAYGAMEFVLSKGACSFLANGCELLVGRGCRREPMRKS